MKGILEMKEGKNAAGQIVAHVLRPMLIIVLPFEN